MKLRLSLLLFVALLWPLAVYAADPAPPPEPTPANSLIDLFNACVTADAMLDKASEEETAAKAVLDACSQNRVAAKQLADQAAIAFLVEWNKRHNPPPNPIPPPPPPPPVPIVDHVQVIIVEENANHTPELASMFWAKTTRDFLAAGGHKPFWVDQHVIDPATNKTPANLTVAITAAAGKTLPYFVLTTLDGQKIVYEGAPPKTSDDLIALVKSKTAKKVADDSYRAAYAAALIDSQPLVVLAGATWCEPCRRVAPLIPLLRQQGHFAYVDLDLNRADAQGLGVVSVPTLAVYRRIDGKWQLERYVGEPRIHAFIKGE
jgi:thiol-disulfide isomerase/thioredoxin